MATGYTYRVVEGKTTTLKDFALHCATAFIYDCSTLPEKFVDTDQAYNKDGLVQAKKELKALKALKTEKAQMAYGQAIIDRGIAYAEDAITKKKVIVDRLKAMKKQVTAWKPPKTVQNVKRYMLEQLDETMRCDGNIDFYLRDLERYRAADPMQYYKSALKNAARDVVYYQKKIAEGKKMTAKNNKWLKDLRKSL